MTEPKFTQGPWDISDLREGKNPMELLEICALKCNELVCVGRIDKRVSKNQLDQEDEANARLIAAAPEMYDALVGQVDNWKSQTCQMFINSGTEPEQCYYCVNKKCEAARQIKTIRDLLVRINGEESK